MSAPEHPMHVPNAEPSAPAAPAPENASFQRTHPLTPLLGGWSILGVFIGMFLLSRLDSWARDFSVGRLIAFGIGLGLVVIAGVLLSLLGWFFTQYQVSADGVSLRTGAISRSNKVAPREKIESVSVERPFLARVVGLAKVRVEIAGGDDSHLDIAYVSNAEAERLRATITDVARQAAIEEAASQAQSAGAAPGNAHSRGLDGRLKDFIADGVTEGELIAQIPNVRLMRSMIRDLSFVVSLIAVALSLAAGVGASIVLEEPTFISFIVLFMAIVSLGGVAFNRLAAGWGFTSRDTDRGLRMRRGLFSTRTDNVGAGRIQFLTLSRPFFWRGPRWTKASVRLAGTSVLDTDSTAQDILPVGTSDELHRTLGHLIAPLGTENDWAVVEHYLTAPARELEGWRVRNPLFFISRRTQVTALLPGAVVHRTGIFTRTVRIVPRERVQQTELTVGPWRRLMGMKTVSIEVAAGTTTIEKLPAEAAQEIFTILGHDAGTLRRYRDREQWPQPLLSRA